jgi:magnesium transporter
MLVDSAVYVDGRRTMSATLGDAPRICREPGRFVWVTLHEPTEEEFVSAAGEFGLDELTIEDAIKPHQRPKLERHGDYFFVVLKSTRYVEATRKIEFGEVHVFVEPDFIVIVLYGEEPAPGNVREALESDPDRLRRGPVGVLYEVMHQIIEGYAPVVEGLENDMDEIEAEVFGGNVGASRRIHELAREIIRFHQATKPLAGALEQLMEGGPGDLNPEVRKYLRHLRDQVLRVTEQTEGFGELLFSILGVNLTMVGIQQNDQMQKISAWAAILIVPSLIAGIFGMNFEEAWWINASYGFEIMIALMILISVLLYLSFRRSGWL